VVSSPDSDEVKVHLITKPMDCKFCLQQLTGGRLAEQVTFLY